MKEVHQCETKTQVVNMRRLYLHAFLLIAILHNIALFVDGFTLPSTHCSNKITSSQRRPLQQYGGRNIPTKLFSSKSPPPPEFLKGMPSTPGFKPGQFERLTSWAMSQDSNRAIVTEYDPDGLWLWTQWEGTIREMTFSNVAIALVWALVVDLYAYQHYTVYLIATAAVNGGDVATLVDNLTWTSFDIPHSGDPIIETFQSLNSLWEYQLQLTTFTLSFFVNHAYSYWRMTYFCTRSIQGRLNDLCLLVTLAAQRSNKYGEVDGVTSYNTNAKKLVKDVTRLLRMSHTMFWAATPTRSDGMGDLHLTEGGMIDDELNLEPTQFGPMLLSPEGLEMLVRYGQISKREREGLVACGLPPSQYAYTLLQWAGLRVMDGIEKGDLRGGPGLEENFLRQISSLRGEYFNIGDYNAGRMPMAYVQIMEVLVDTLTFLAPLALYTKMGTFNIISTGLLTLFFKGLLELSKSFLDPFGKDGYSTHNINVDVLVSELNFGASSRWVDAGDCLPSETTVKVEPLEDGPTTITAKRLKKSNGVKNPSITGSFDIGEYDYGNDVAYNEPLIKFDRSQKESDL